LLRSYSARLVALTTGSSSQWLDNLLSRYVLPGVSRHHRGVERRINDEGLLAVELVRMLNLELGVSVENGVVIASHVLKRASPAPDFRTPSGLVLHFPLESIQQRLRSRLSEATEFVAQVRRGRPSRRANARPDA